MARRGSALVVVLVALGSCGGKPPSVSSPRAPAPPEPSDVVFEQQVTPPLRPTTTTSAAPVEPPCLGVTDTDLIRGSELRPLTSLVPTDDRVCAATLAGPIQLRLQWGSLDEIRARLTEIGTTSSSVASSHLDSLGQGQAIQYWRDDNSTAIGVGAELAIVIDQTADSPDDLWSAPPMDAVIEFVLAGRDPALEGADVTRPALTPAAVQCGRSFVAVNADQSVMLSLAVHLSDDELVPSTRLVAISDGASGTLTLGTNLGANRCTDVWDEPEAVSEQQCPVVAGTVTYEIARSPACRTATVSATGLIVERPDGVVVPLADIVIPNPHYTYEHPDGCWPPLPLPPAPQPGLVPGSVTLREISADGRRLVVDPVPSGDSCAALQQLVTVDVIETEEMVELAAWFAPAPQSAECIEPAVAFGPVDVHLDAPLGARTVHDVTVRGAVLLPPLDPARSGIVPVTFDLAPGAIVGESAPGALHVGVVGIVPSTSPSGASTLAPGLTLPPDILQLPLRDDGEVLWFGLYRQNDTTISLVERSEMISVEVAVPPRPSDGRRLIVTVGPGAFVLGDEAAIDSSAFQLSWHP